MIKAVIILNALGKVCLLKIYESFIPDTQKVSFLQELHTKASQQKDKANFILCEQFTDCIIVFKRYANMVFIVVCDENENELAILYFITIFTTAVSKFFLDLNELDFICSPEKINYILYELIVDGNVI